MDLTRFGFKVVGRAPQSEVPAWIKPFAAAGLDYEVEGTDKIKVRLGRHGLEVSKNGDNIRAFRKNGAVILGVEDVSVFAKSLKEIAAWPDAFMLGRLRFERSSEFSFSYKEGNFKVACVYGPRLGTLHAYACDVDDDNSHANVSVGAHSTPLNLACVKRTIVQCIGGLENAYNDAMKNPKHNSGLIQFFKNLFEAANGSRIEARAPQAEMSKEEMYDKARNDKAQALKAFKEAVPEVVGVRPLTQAQKAERKRHFGNDKRHLNEVVWIALGDEGNTVLMCLYKDLSAEVVGEFGDVFYTGTVYMSGHTMNVHWEEVSWI
jgi:hypothetical protein